MTQQKSRLCFAAMKLAQWPSLTLGVSRVLWPGHLKGQSISSTTYSCTSTLAQVEKPTKHTAVQKVSAAAATPSSSDSTRSNKPSNVEPAAEEPSAQSLNKVIINQHSSFMKSAPTDKNLSAVLKVKSLSEALEVCSTFNPHECLAALENLAAVQSRSIPLIQNLTEGVSRSIDSFNVKELSDLLFSLGKLSYIDSELLTKTCGALKANIEKTHGSSVLNSSITSLRVLQWKDPELLDELSMWILKNFKKYQNPINFIYTLALQNHSPKSLDELVQLVWERSNMSHASPSDTVNFLWSLSVLNCKMSKQVLEQNVHHLFTPNFLRKLDSSPYMIPVWKKLSNLYGASRSFLTQNSRLSIPKDVNNLIKESPVRNDKVIMVSEVVGVLFKDMDTVLYSTFVPTDMGFSVDLVCNLDDQMRAVPVRLSGPSCKRVAIMVHSYHECLLPTKEPNGFRTFEMRLLEGKFKTISLPYHITSGGHARVYEYFESALKNIAKE